jgi:glycosyltransferase involved in cell wall biosynthesis
VVSFSVIIVTHAREELLMKCLDSLHPGVESWQLIIVANGKELNSDLKSKASALTSNFILIDTDEIFPPGKARNQAVLSAEGEWIFFLDDDAIVLPGYWEIALPLLKETKIDVLGGPDSPAEGMNTLGMALALTLASPFCTGATFVRHKPQGRKLLPADEEKLTSCNLWVRKSSINGIRFPEDYLRAEEIVFLQKLKQSGRAEFYHPGLKVAHHRRTKLQQLLKPTYYAGFYRSKLIKEKLKTGNEAFYLPAFFVLLHLLFFLEPLSFWYLARLYLGIILFVSLGISVQAKRFSLFPLVAFLHYFVVFMYGIGFISERIHRIKG